MNFPLINKILPYLFSFLIWVLVIFAASLLIGPALAPRPYVILETFIKLTLSGELFQELGLTALRALTGVFLANLCGLPLGLIAGRQTKILQYISPLIAGLQSCPPVIWITLVMIWAGTGSIVPIATVFAATLPFVFSASAQGAMAIDKEILAMSQLYEVPPIRLLKLFILPSVLPFWLATLSSVLAAGWKAAAVAEFLGSQNGVGSRIYWCFSRLDMEELNAWTLGLIILGVLLEGLLITPLRKKAALLSTKGVEA